MKTQSRRDLFQEGVVNINDLPFQKHNDRGKCHAMMAFNYEMKIIREQHKASKNEPDLSRLAQQVQNLFKFKIYMFKWTLMQVSVQKSQNQSLSLLIPQVLRLVQNKPLEEKGFKINPWFSSKKITRSYLVLITCHFMSQPISMSQSSKAQ